MAGVKYARVTFYPILPDQNQQSATVTTEIHAKIKFVPDENPEAETTSSKFVPQTATPEAIIEVAEKGIVILDYQSLLALGASVVNKSPENWQLHKNGTAVPMHFVGDNDATFEANEYFLFYNDGAFSRWTDVSAFTLSHLNEIGARMPISFPVATSASAADLTQTILLEEDLLYTPNCFCGQLPAGHNGDRWTWQELKSPGTNSTTIPFTLEDFDTNESAEVTIHMIGFTDMTVNNDHGLSVELNGQSLGTLIWDGKTAHSETLTIPAGKLTASNELLLTLDQGAGAIDGVWLDAVEVNYTKGNDQLNLGSQTAFQAFSANGKLTLQPASSNKLWGINVSDVANPEMIVSGLNSNQSFTLDVPVNAQQAVVFSFEDDLIQPTSVRSPHGISTAEGDYILIAPDAFHAGLDGLVNLRTEQGLSVVLASLEGIYDQFGNGNAVPGSIEAYLQNAYDNWAIQPKYVVLVGDGTYDPKLNLENSKPTILPINFANVDPWAGEIASDNRYVLLDGDDALPDVAIGRLPVNSTDELATVVSKIVDYPTKNLAWRNNITFIADNTDSAGDFTLMGDTISHLIESTRYQISRFEFDGDDETLPSIKSGVFSNWGSGQGHLVYAGHSTVHQWADESFVHISQVEELQNRTKQPIVLQMTCFTGSYQMPGLDSFDEAMVRYENGGGVAVWGSTGLGVATGHDSLIEGYFETLKNHETTKLGDAVMAGKLELMTHKPSNVDLLDTFNLLGDPALLISPPDGAIVSYLPIIQR